MMVQLGNGENVIFQVGRQHHLDDHCLDDGEDHFLDDNYDLVLDDGEKEDRKFIFQ